MADKAVKVAQIHTSFNIFRDVHEAHTGPVTLEEQIKALQRFVRWHERQVVVGQQLLAQLTAAKTNVSAEATAPTADTPAGPAAEVADVRS